MFFFPDCCCEAICYRLICEAVLSHFYLGHKLLNHYCTEKQTYGDEMDEMV